MKKIFSLVAVSLFACVLVFAENPKNPEYGISVDFAYYPASDHISTGMVDSAVMQFAPLTGAYSGLEGRINLYGTYTIPTPLGDHWLLNGANVSLTEKLEITPVSIMPITSVSFTPLPFLVFNAGFQVGTGWDIGNLFKGGMSIYDPTLENTNNYTALGAFTNMFTKYWLQGTFQFDTGAIFEGDWTHVQMMYTYQTYYEGLTGVADKELWAWQCTPNKVNGVKEYQQAILAYAMPLKLSRVGLLFESERFYRDDVYKNELYKASVNNLSLSAMGQIKFSEKDTLTVLFHFATRPAFLAYDAKLPESHMITTGAEWYFKRIALSYSHAF